ncbi:hypothetical protein P3X46_020908 [Hevea brasiliensis]|uniref:Uncharacterized protein n=1 Tax=Hevea brasiliensis TaxID=3981 RepID=A0ABQ9LDX7_HEVBR|nr:hypothetical protein P3X46_020908 [Hevea brasiliensis]
MKRFYHEESVLLGYSPQTSFMNHPISSPKSPCRNSSDIDFNDVFGGPPSLSAKLIKGSDLPTFGSSARNHHRNKDGTSDGVSLYSYSPLNDVYFHSPLLHEQSLGSEELPNFVKPDEKNKGNDLKLDSNRSKVPTISDQFQFSIYKWASKGVPLALPVGGGNGPKWKVKFKFERCSSASGRMASEGMEKELPTVTPQDIDCPSFNISKENGYLFNISTHSGIEQGQTFEEAILPKCGPEIPSTHHEDGPGTDEITIENELEESKMKSIKKSAAVFDVSEKANKQDGKGTILNNVEMDKSILQGSPTKSGDSLAKNRIRGKVKEFVKIFNQEASNKPQFNVDSQTQSSRWNERVKFKTEDDASVNSTKVYEEVHLPYVNKNNTPDASIVAPSFRRFLF